jgi:hypothetical protein
MWLANGLLTSSKNIHVKKKIQLYQHNNATHGKQANNTWFP